MSVKPNDFSDKIQVSVIIPNFNYARYLEQCIQSVLDSDFDQDKMEIIVVDDASTDGSVKLIEQMMKNSHLLFRLIKNEINFGVTLSRNRGITHAAGEFLFFLDSDNYIHKDCIKTHLAILQQNQDAIACFAPIQEFLDNTGEYCGLRSNHPFDYLKLCEGNYIDAMAMFRKKDLTETGMYDKKMPPYGWEDYELWLRLSKLSKQVIFIEGEPLSFYRIHQLNKSRIRKPDQYNHLVYYLKQKHPLNIPLKQTETIVNLIHQKKYVAQLFYTTDDADFSEQNSILVEITENPFHLKLPARKTFRALRFDPLNNYAVVKIKGIRFFNAGNEIFINPKIKSNAVADENSTYFFSTTDPQITTEFDVPLLMDEVVIDIEYLKTGGEVIEELDKIIQIRIENINAQPSEKSEEMGKMTKDMNQIMQSTPNEIDRFPYQNTNIKDEFAAIKSSRSYKTGKLLTLIHPLRLAQRLKEKISIRKNLRMIKESDLFDKKYYLKNNPDVAAAGMNPAMHYFNFGGFEGRNPSEVFDSTFYMEKYPEVRKSGINPLIHYVMYGKKEGRVCCLDNDNWRKTLKTDNYFKVDLKSLQKQTENFSLGVLLIAETSIPQCKKYRVTQKAQMFSLLNIRCTVVSWQQTSRALELLQTHKIVVFYRVPATKETLGMVEEANLLGVKCYYELDDLIFDRKLFRKNPNLRKLNTDVIRNLMEGSDSYRRMLIACKNVIASTNDLAARMQKVGGGEQFVLENAIDRETLEILENLQNNNRNGKIRIFYGSGTDTHDVDLLEAAVAIKRLVVENENVEIVLAGEITHPAEWDKLGDRLIKFPPLPFIEYFQLLGSVDISIVPLADVPFNDSKSNIKFLEASLLGIPSVCSPRISLMKAIKQGENGFLADTVAEWYETLKKLATDEKLRIRIGNTAKEFVMKNYSPEHIAHDQLLPFCYPHQPAEMKKLRVMIVNIYFSPLSYGGATIVAEAMAEHFSENRNTEVAIFTSFSGHEIDLREFVRTSWRDVPVFRVLVSGEEIGSKVYVNIRALKHFEESLLAFRPNVVHFHSIQGFGSGVTQTCQKLRIPYIITLHDAWWVCERQFLFKADGTYCGQEKISFSVCRKCVEDIRFSKKRTAKLHETLERAAMILTPSEYWRRFYIANGVNPSKIRVNKNGISIPQKAHPNIAGNGKLRFGFVAGNEKVKGFIQVKAAFESLQTDAWELLIVDHSQLMKNSKPFPEVINGKGNVRFVEKYTHKTIDEFFDTIDVLLFPTQNPESFGLTVREALIRNKWVIATNGGGVAEAIHNGINGTLIQMSPDSSYLQKAVEELLLNPERLKGWVNPFSHDIRSFEEQAFELRGIIESVV